MKRLTVVVTAEDESDIPKLLANMTVRYSGMRIFGIESCPLITQKGCIYWKLEDGSHVNMMNMTLIEEEGK